MSFKNNYYLNRDKMQGIISYHKDDFFLINDKNYNAGKFIGKIKSIGQKEVTLNIYIFPEDTKEGRKQHMSVYEVFLTNNEMFYKFNGQEVQVSVTDLPNYVKKRFILKENLSSRKLYFQRQIYLDNGQFEPSLQKICYCQEYFNPDFIFKICNCGNYFHPICFMRSQTNKCWNKNCNVDCSIFFSFEEMFDMKKKISQSQGKNPGSSSPMKKSLVISESIFSSKNPINNKSIDDEVIQTNESITLDEFAEFNTAELIKKGKKKVPINDNATIERFLTKIHLQEKEKEKKIKQEPFINLGIKTEKNNNHTNSPIKSNPKIFDTTFYEKKNGYSTLIKVEPNYQEESKKKTDAEREKTRKIIYENLINGVKILQKNTKIIDDFEKVKPNLKVNISLIREKNTAPIESHFKELAASIEIKLFDNCDKNVNSTYFAFLQEFALLIKNSQQLLFRVILGDLTAEEISKFKGEDFLPEEKRKQKEQLKQKEIQKMKFDGPMEVKAISNKGRMLTEIQDNIEVNKNINFNMDTQISLNVEEKQFLPNGKINPRYEYYRKLQLMHDKYPSLSENDIKFMVESKEPTEDDIQNKLNSIIQENLNWKDIEELFTFRKQRLTKKAEKYYKKENDGMDKGLLKEKVQKYIEKNSFALKPH